MLVQVAAEQGDPGGVPVVHSVLLESAFTRSSQPIILVVLTGGSQG